MNELGHPFTDFVKNRRTPLRFGALMLVGSLAGVPIAPAVYHETEHFVTADLHDRFTTTEKYAAGWVLPLGIGEFALLGLAEGAAYLIGRKPELAQPPSEL
jgi:hypothetical protein